MTNDTGAWVELLNARTTAAELEHIIAEQVSAQLVDVLEQIEALGLSPGDQRAALVQIHRILLARTTAALTAGWRDLQTNPEGLKLDAMTSRALH